jgi:hypothetical protein
VKLLSTKHSQDVVSDKPKFGSGSRYMLQDAQSQDTWSRPIATGARLYLGILIIRNADYSPQVLFSQDFAIV